MYDKHFVGFDLTGFQDNGLQRPISRVTFLLDDQNAVTAGDDTGIELTADCPHATQTMVDSVLAQVRGYQYRMFAAEDANLDPAAELGDGVTVGTVYSVVSRIASDGSGYAGVAAPGEAELEDEFPATGPMTQAFRRQIAQTRSEITKTSDRITQLVMDEARGLEGKINLTAASLTTEINNTRDGLNSRIEQTAASLSTEISNTRDGLNSRITQTASEINTQISGINGTVSALQQTASSLSFTAQSHENQITSLWDAMNGFSLEVSNGEYSSTLSLMSGRTVLSSREISINGMVTFSDLSQSGRTVINGANLSTGTINAGSVSVTDEFALWQNGFRYGYMGCGYGYDGERNTWGAKLSDDSGQNYLLAANSGVRMQDNYGGAIWVTGGNCFSSSDMMTWSDRRLKEDIDHDLACYQKFFRGLRPCRFLLKNNPMEGYHTGFIAQEVEEAMDAANLSPMDFTGLGRVRLPDGTEGYALRYGAFTALNTYMIQELERRVAELERILQRADT